MKILLYVVVFFGFIFSSVSSNSHESDVIHTHSGPVRGVASENTKQFLGIPYATAKRFQPPVDVPKWTTTLNAAKRGPMCYQTCPPSPPRLCQKEMSEDCLTLNIWVPLHKPEGSTFAVMVFIHGGNFVSYSGGSPLFDGDVFVKKGGVILVTFNYRLGVFGFSSRVVDDKVVSGNHGLLDQEKALEWVYKNIQAFGGDPSRITLFGQSAGAQSIVVHLTSQRVSSYFHRAIIQSLPLTLPFRNVTEAETQMRLFLHQLHCDADDVLCLREKSSAEILQAQEATPKNGFSDIFLMQFEAWGPVNDGEYITGNQKDMLESAKIDKNIIVGTVSNEGIAYIYFVITYSIPEFLFSFFLDMLIPGSSQVAEHYDVKEDARDTLSKLATDFIFYCPSRNFVDSWSKSKNVWFYLFDQPLSFNAWVNQSYCDGNVCHGGELPFLFDTPYLAGYTVTKDDEKLSTAMIGYWTNFAKYGNPNHGNGLLHWPKYTPSSGSRKRLIFTEPNVLIADADRDTQCASLNKQGYRLNG